MDEKKKPPCFQIYLDSFVQVKFLNLSERGELFTALFEYATKGEIIDFSSERIAIVFSFFKTRVDRDFQKYAERCQQNAINARKRGATASDGKRPLATASDGSQYNPTQFKHNSISKSKQGNTKVKSSFDANELDKIR